MQIQKRHLIISAIILFFIVTLLFNSSLLKNESQTFIPSKDQSIVLNGKWEFYWQQQLEPRDFDKQQLQAEYIEVPKAWETQKISSGKLSNVGFGTYRKTFTIPQQYIGRQQALMLEYVASSYRIWINGDEYPGLGKVGKTIEEEIPHLQRNIVVFEPITTTVEVVIQVSNFSFRDGGIIGDVSVGPAPTMIRSVLIPSFLSLLQIGSAFIIGIYYLVIYYRRKTDLDFYYFGLLALVYALRVLLLNEYVVSIIFPSVPWLIVAKLTYLNNIAALLLLALLIKHMYPVDANNWYIKILYVLSLCFSFIVVFTKPYDFTSFLFYNTAAMVGILLIFIVDLSIKVKRRQREDANINIASVFMLLSSVVYEVSNYIWTFSSIYILDIAFFIFILLQAVILSNRYNRIQDYNKVLTEELVLLNSSLEEKIKQRTSELISKNQELSTLQQAKTKMLANIAHDIGTPLGGVITYLQILMEGHIKVDRQLVLKELVEQVKYVQYLNKDLLELSKLESKEMIFHLENVKAESYLYTVYESLQLENEKSTVQLQLGRCEAKIDNQDAYISIDQMRIRQVMYNFLSNAIKYNESDMKEMTLHWYIDYNVHKQRHEIIVAFEDNGRGVPQEELPFIFDRFYRVVEGNIDGSGLGLAIVKEIIEQHNGEVGVKKKQGEGSIFYFTLPASTK